MNEADFGIRARTRPSSSPVKSIARVICAAVIATTLVVGASRADEPQIKPQFDRCTLTLDGRTTALVAVLDPWGPQYSVGEGEARRLFVLRRDAVDELSIKDCKSLWSVQSGDGIRLSWLTASGDVAYFIGYRAADDRRPESWVPEAPPRLRRLDLASHRWLEPLPLSPLEVKQKELRLNRLGGGIL